MVSLDCDSKGNLWIATLKDGLFVYDSKSMEFSEVEVGHLLPLQDGNRTDVSIVFADKDDNIWLSAASHIIKCSYEGGRLKAEFSRPAFYPMAIEQDENGTVWIATASEYICYFRPGDSEMQYLKPFTMDYTFIPSILPYLSLIHI